MKNGKRKIRLNSRNSWTPLLRNSGKPRLAVLKRRGGRIRRRIRRHSRRLPNG
jgi:hypothetical protein